MIPTLLISLLALSPPAQPPVTWTVHWQQPTVQVSPDLYGIFFEEINCGGDGGLYAEMVRNRGFEDDTDAGYWDTSLNNFAGTYGPVQDEPLSKQSPTSYRVEVQKGRFDLINQGYWGMGVQKGSPYTLSLYAQSDSGKPLEIALVDSGGNTLAQTSLRPNTKWTKLTTTLRPNATEPNAKLRIRFDQKGTTQVDMVSLFPAKTWKGRANGLRTDLAEKLDGLKPAFMRFPGGCWVEGDTMATSQRWKQTVGALQDRRTQPNIWGYQSTNGLGYHEYLQLCEDLKAAPLFVINCGMSHKEVVPMDKMGEFVQDALDAIEYANGPVTSKWGALRAKNGHPKPFGLKYLEIGNENGGPAYEERYGLIYRAVKAKYPEIKTVACLWGGSPKKTPIELLDEHYYNTPEFFLQNANRYDKYDRKGPKIYVGEYAVTIGCGQGNLIAAVGEAAFMTGMERNSDIVRMASYAPLFANVNHKGWNPDLICFDTARSYGTPSYWVQQMFSQNRPERILKSELSEQKTTKPKFPTGGIGVGTWNTQAEFKDIKVVQGGKTIFESADGSALKNETGTWSVVDGALRQTTGEQPARAFAGDPSWHNYTVTLKARKLGGVEGFLVTVGRRDKGNYIWWNVGGWGNTQGALEMGIDGGKSVMGRQVDSRVETGRWYDLRVDYSEDRIRCYQDGKLVYDEEMPSVAALHVTSGVAKNGEIILKVVNGGPESKDMDIVFDKPKANFRVLKAETLTSGSKQDENTLDNPLKVSPKAVKVEVRDGRIHHRFAPYSVTVIRLNPNG